MPDRPDDPFDPRFHRQRQNGADPRGAYDRDRQPRPSRDPQPFPLDEPSRSQKSTRRFIALLAGLVALLLVALFAYRMTRAGPGEDRLDDEVLNASTAGARSADSRCGDQRTYDLVKRELFRRAAQIRGSDAGAFDRLSAYAVLRISSPVEKREDEQLGTLVCSGAVALDLPPGVAVIGGRRTLEANVDYALQPAADGSGDVVTLSGADGIIVPLATLARTGTQPELPREQQPAPQVPPVPIPAPLPADPPASMPSPQLPQPADPSPPIPPTATARPSFNCANARTRGEIAVCRSERLATLDRRMAAEFVGALRQATPAQRALLQRTRDSFLGYRDRCRSDACIAGAYQDRIREIRDIINDRWNGR